LIIEREQAASGNQQQWSGHIISLAVGALYWHIDTLHLGALPSRIATFALFIGYGLFTQYFINANKRMAEKMLEQSMIDQLTGL